MNVSKYLTKHLQYVNPQFIIALSPPPLFKRVDFIAIFNYFCNLHEFGLTETLSSKPLQVLENQIIDYQDG